MYYVKILYVFALIVVSANAVVIPLKTCGSDYDRYCDVHEVSIDPCKSPQTKCLLRLGKPAVIRFDYTPKFNATTLLSMAYWDSDAELPFVGMDGDGCKFTTCPTVAGQKQHFNQEFHIGRQLPKGNYPIKWKLWNLEDQSQACCFKANIQLL